MNSIVEAWVGRVSFPLSSALLNRRGILASYRDLLASEHWDRDRLAALQLSRLKAVLAHAHRHVPFYRERFADAGLHPNDIHELEDLKGLPPVTREEVFERHHDMVDERCRPYLADADASSRGPGEPVPWALFRRSRLIRNTSSGSTGAPTTFYEDGGRTALNWALDFRHRRWFGVQPGASEARMLRGRRDLHTESRIPGLRRTLWNQLMLPGINLNDADYALCVEELNRFRPSVLWGFTSAWVGLAEYMREHSVRLASWQPRVAVTWAAPLYDHEREVLADVFRCPITNNYGAREVGHVAGACREGRLHIYDEHALVEIDSSDAATEEGVGEILCTTLDVMVMPFIRYRMGDLGRVSSSPCACGRKLRIIDKFVGRTGEVYRTRDGRLISPNFWCRTFMNPALGGKIKRFQAIYEKSGDIRVEIVRGPGYDYLAEAALHDHLRVSFGDATRTRLSYVDSIATHASGKYRMVKNEQAACCDRSSLS